MGRLTENDPFNFLQKRFLFSAFLSCLLSQYFIEAWNQFFLFILICMTFSYFRVFHFLLDLLCLKIFSLLFSLSLSFFLFLNRWLCHILFFFPSFLWQPFLIFSVTLVFPCLSYYFLPQPTTHSRFPPPLKFLHWPSICFILNSPPVWIFISLLLFVHVLFSVDSYFFFSLLHLYFLSSSFLPLEEMGKFIYFYYLVNYFSGSYLFPYSLLFFASFFVFSFLLGFH